jgi:hypothetical protein
MLEVLSISRTEGPTQISQISGTDLMEIGSWLHDLLNDQFNLWLQSVNICVELYN